jgi:hypothetical protein
LDEANKNFKKISFSRFRDKASPSYLWMTLLGKNIDLLFINQGDLKGVPGDQVNNNSLYPA